MLDTYLHCSATDFNELQRWREKKKKVTRECWMSDISWMCCSNTPREPNKCSRQQTQLNSCCKLWKWRTGQHKRTYSRWHYTSTALRFIFEWASAFLQITCLQSLQWPRWQPQSSMWWAVSHQAWWTVRWIITCCCHVTIAPEPYNFYSQYFYTPPFFYL